MAEQTRVKEVGADGLPIQRLGGWLIGDLHQYFTDDIDRMLRLGWVDEEEYVALTAATNAALTAFQEGLPDTVSSRAYGESAYMAAAQAKMEDMQSSMPEAPPLLQSPPTMAMHDKGDGMSKALTAWLGNFADSLNKVLNKETFDETAWDGSASNYKTAASYCAACLIDTNPSGAPKTKDKCHLPVRKEGSKAINKNALRALASGGRGIPALKGVPPAAKTKAAKFAVSHWQAAFGKPAPASMYKMAGMAMPASMKSKELETSVKFFQDKKGDWWMLGIYSNHWKDLQGEILSEAAHKEYADWINKSGFQPAVTLAHMPRLSEKFWIQAFRKFGNDVPAFNQIIGEIYKDYGFARVKRIIPLNGFAVALAQVDPDKKEMAAKLAQQADLGMSHGCVSMKEMVDFNLDTSPVTIVDKYRSFELTVLRQENAANAVTIPIFVEARTMAKAMSDADREFLTQVLPEDLVDNVDEITATIEKQMNERLAFKDTDPEEPVKEEEATSAVEPVAEEPAAVAPAVEPADEVIEKVIKALNLGELRDALVGMNTQIADLSKQVAELGELRTEVKALNKTEDEKIAEKIAPPARPGFDWGIAASRSDETVIKKEKAENVTKVKVGAQELAPDKPKLDRNNPLHAMVYQPLTRDK